MDENQLHEPRRLLFRDLRFEVHGQGLRGSVKEMKSEEVDRRFAAHVIFAHEIPVVHDDLRRGQKVPQSALSTN